MRILPARRAGKMRMNCKNLFLLFPSTQIYGLGNRLRWNQRTRLDHICKLLCFCYSILGNIAARWSIANTIMHQVKRGRVCDETGIRTRCRSALLLCHVNDIVCGNINALNRTCNDAGTSCAGGVFALVDIDADTVDFTLGGGIEDANATTASDLEEDVGHIIANLLISDS